MTVLIDGSSFAKAAFVPAQNALCHRFLSRIFKVNLEERGRPITVAWDAGDNVSGRRARFLAYKAGHDGGRFGSEYAEQAFELRSLLPLLGVHQAWSDGWEADDVLGTLARSAPGKVLLLTRDRDLIQLVDGRVVVLLKVGSREHLLGEQGAEKFLGFSPHVHRDWKALAGDAGDGVPGIDGIGEKTATELVSWRSTVVQEALDGVLPPGTPDLSPRARSALRRLSRDDVRERLGLMRWLVSLHRVPVTYVRGRLDLNAARREFAASGLRLLGARLGEWGR